MSIVIEERFLSRRQSEGDTSSAELVYIAHATGGESDVAVKWAAIQNSPESYDGLVRKSAHLEQLAECHYEVAVEYGESKRPDIGDFSFTFDTTGATQKMTQAREHLGDYAAPGETAPNFYGAINVTKDNVEGVDIPSRQYRMTETRTFHAWQINQAYLDCFMLLTGTVNQSYFRNKAPGEILFLGGSGSYRGEDKFEITYQFSYSPSAYNIVAGDIVIPVKRGWDYLWFRYADTEDDSAKVMVKRPVSAHLERVFDYTNFALLGIGI